MASVGKGMEKRDPYALLEGMQIGTATMEKRMECLPQVQSRTTI